MKLRRTICSLALPSLASLLAFSFTNCKSTSSLSAVGGSGSTSVVSQAGASGEADDTRHNLSVCGKPALVECDPITAAPCNLAQGETCDYSIGRARFICLHADAFSRAHEACGADAPDCGPSTTCDDPVCQHYCCSDSDCDEGTCALDTFEDGDTSIGVCLDETAKSK